MEGQIKQVREAKVLCLHHAPHVWRRSSWPNSLPFTMTNAHPRVVCVCMCVYVCCPLYPSDAADDRKPLLLTRCFATQINTDATH